METVARQGIYNLIQQFPLDPKERRDLLPPTERERTAEDDCKISHINTERVDFIISRKINQTFELQ